ncbi:reverse transcriptase domain-containing protein [Tanacetum coccineum]
MQDINISKQKRNSRLINKFDKFVAEYGESLTSVYDRFSTLINVMDRNKVTPKEISINTKFLNSFQPEWSKYVTLCRQKYILVDEHFDVFPSYSHSPQPYYVTHPSSVIDNDVDYQGEIQGDAQEDKLSTAMILLARAITQRFSTPTNNHLRTSSNTRNQAVIQDGRVDIQSKNIGYDRNERLKGSKSRVNSGKDKHPVLQLQWKSPLSVIMMAHIQPTDDKSNAEPTYDAEFTSKVNASQINMINGLLLKSDYNQRHHEKLKTIIHTFADDQIDSDIIFDDHYVDYNSGQAEHDTIDHDQSLHEHKSMINNRNEMLMIEMEKISNQSKDIQANFLKRIKILENDFQRSQVQSINFELKLEHRKEKIACDISWKSKMEKLNAKLKTAEKGKNVNTNFNKAATLEKLICVTPLNKNRDLKAKMVPKVEVKTDKSKPVTSNSKPKNELDKKRMQIVASTSSVRRPESKDNNFKKRVLQHTKFKGTSNNVMKSHSSVSLVSNKHDTLNSNVSELSANVLKARNVNIMDDGLNLGKKSLVNFPCSETHPPMLEKGMYDSWKTWIMLYIRGKENDKDGVTDIRREERLKDLKGDDKLRYDNDIKAVNILLLELPVDIYTLINHYQTAKEIWDRVKELMKGIKMTKQECESMLYDEFDKFTSEPRELIHSYYLRYAKLINDMNMIPMSMTPMQINTKFVNHLQPNWSRFVTAAKQARDLHSELLISCTLSSNTMKKMLKKFVKCVNDSQNHLLCLHIPTTHLLYTASLSLQSYAPLVVQQPPTFQPDIGLSIPTFLLIDDPIDSLNKAMMFFSRQSQGYTSNAKNNQALGAWVINVVVNTGVNQPRVIRCYNCKGKGHMAKPCTTRKRVNDSEWFKEKMLLAQEQEAGVILDEHQQDFLVVDHVDAYDSDCDNEATANAIFIENLSHVGSLNDYTVAPRYDSDTLSEDILKTSYLLMIYTDYILTIGDDADTYVPHPVQKNDMMLSLIEQMNLKLKTVTSWEQSDIKGAFKKDVIPFSENLKETFKLFKKGFIAEVNEMKEIFEQIEDEVDQCSVAKKCFEIEKKQLLINNDRLLEENIASDIMCTYLRLLNEVGNCGKCESLDIVLLDIQESNKSLSELRKCFAKHEEYNITLDIAFQNQKEQMILNNPDTKNK